MIISAVGNEFPTADIISLQFFAFFVFSNDNMLQITEYEYCVGATLLDCNALHWRRQWGGTAELSNKASTNTVYTKQQTDASLAKKANADAVYTKQQTDTALAKKVAIALSLDAAISAGTAIAVKDSSGNVSISLIDISRKDNAAFTGDGTLIATLPEGFRPMGSWRWSNCGTITEANGVTQKDAVVTLTADSNGRITAWHRYLDVNSKKISGSFSFPSTS